MRDEIENAVWRQELFGLTNTLAHGMMKSSADGGCLYAINTG